MMVSYLSTRFLLCILSAGSLLDMSTWAEPLRGEEITKVKKGEYPYVVSIGHKDNRYHEEAMHICSGVLITNKFVLTAAHCFDADLSDGICVILGSVDLRKGKKYDVSMWITYDQWADSQNTTKIRGNNDIAMVKLSRKVRWLVAIPASLAFQKNDDLLNEYVILASWGVIDEHSEIPSRYLAEAKVKVLPNAVCENISKNIFKKRISLSNKYLCTKGEPYKLLGSGDSGGPVFQNNYVVAISSATCPKFTVCDSPVQVEDEHKFNIHVSVDFYREFIDHVLMNY